MDELHTERCQRHRRKADKEHQHQAIENYWDLRGNRGNIFIIPSHDIAEEVLANVAATTPPQGGES